MYEIHYNLHGTGLIRKTYFPPPGVYNLRNWEGYITLEFSDLKLISKNDFYHDTCNASI